MLALMSLLALPLATHPSALPPTRAELEPRRFKLRTGSLGLGTIWRPLFSSYFGNPLPCGQNIACGLSPTLGFDFEFGSRHARLLVGSWHAPIPQLPDDADLVVVDAMIFDLGALFGNENIRGGLAFEGGVMNIGGAALLRVTPWVDRRGHRHGLELRADSTIWYRLGVTFSYRWHPRSLDRMMKPGGEALASRSR